MAQVSWLGQMGGSHSHIMTITQFYTASVNSLLTQLSGSKV